MKFVYSYQTSSGETLKGELEADSRDAAYGILKGRGIRPMRVVETGGASGGGRVIVTWRRAALTLLAVAAVACAYILGRDVRSGEGEASAGAETAGVRPAEGGKSVAGLKAAGIAAVSSGVVEAKFPRVARGRPRKQIAGVEGVVASNVFVFASERFLAAYACPGRKVPAVTAEERGRVADDLVDALAEDIRIFAGDPPEVVDLKRVVVGMKEEAALFVNGGRSAEDHLLWIEGRQRMEAEYREGLARRVRKGEMSAAEAGRQLEAMSLPGL